MDNASGSARKAAPVNCPQCKGLFRLPEGVSGSSVIVCPMCQCDLAIGDLLDSIPVAEISSESDVRVVSQARSAGMRETASKYEFDERAFTIPKPLKTAERSRRRSHPSRRGSSSKTEPFTPKKAGPGEWFKVLLGGVLALPVAQLILWWVFGVDPLQMAPRVLPYAPALVPPVMRPAQQPDDREEVIRTRDMPEGQILDDDHPPVPIK